MPTGQALCDAFAYKFGNHPLYPVEGLKSIGPQWQSMRLRVQIGPNSSSKTSPNHASNTATSASVIGTRSGQSSLTRQLSTSCLGGRPANGHGSPSSFSSCSDAVGSCWRGFRGIPPDLAMPSGSGTTHVYARLRFVAARADKGDGREQADHGGGRIAPAALSQPRSLVRCRSVLPSRRTILSRRMGGGGQDRRCQHRPEGLVLRGAAHLPMLVACGMQPLPSSWYGRLSKLQWAACRCVDASCLVLSMRMMAAGEVQVAQQLARLPERCASTSIICPRKSSASWSAWCS